MGFRVSLYAVFDCEPAQVQHALGLTPDGETAEFPDSAVAGAVTKAGVYVLCFNDRKLYGEDAIGPIAKRFRYLACTANETCMYSALVAVNCGREEWSVIHDSSKEARHLETHGDVPSPWAAIRRRKFAQQEADGEGVDHIFDIPIELFVELGGVRYDECLESDEPRPWHRLVPVGKPKRRWWRFAK